MRIGTALARTLRGYLETTMSDLVDPNHVVCRVFGDDDPVEAEVTIYGRTFLFHLERSDEHNPLKACGLLGVEERGSGNKVSGPNDMRTWQRIEHFVRFASRA